MSGPERTARVSTLELFFDLVFVFTITQLTGVLTEGKDVAALGQVVVMLLLIWWIYDGYAWLTNAIATDLVRFRLLLLGGMAGFLVIALAVPKAYDGDGVPFGVGYLVVVLLHAGMFVRGTSISEARAILRIAPFNLLAGLFVLAGGIATEAQWILWTASAVMLWLTPRVTTVEGFVISTAHFVERHGLVVIIALGESIVVIGAGASGYPLDEGLVLAAVLALSLSAALWWVYFGDEESVQEAFDDAAPERRPQLALTGFGYWHYGLLLGIVAVAAGLKKAIGDPYDTAELSLALALAGGVALFLSCDVGFRRTFGVAVHRGRVAAALGALATIPIATEVCSAAQIAAIVAVVSASLLAEGRHRTT